MPKNRRFEEIQPPFEEARCRRGPFFATFARVKKAVKKAVAMPSDFSARRILFLQHAAFWAFIFLFVFDYHFVENNLLEAIGKSFLEATTYAAIVYFNLFLLIPFLLEKKRRTAFVVSLAATVVGYIFLMRSTGLEDRFYEMGGWRNVFSMVLNTSLFLLISTLFWFFGQWQTARERLFELKNAQLETELHLLRAQISPHFVFNTLNNIYALALQKHENTAPMVAKLSGILRHVLYESGQKDILLKKEIEAIRQFIDLNLMRKPASTNVDIYVEGDQNGWRIAPMMLLQFVENAFKHSGLDHDERAWIKISVEISADGQLLFSTENSAFEAVSAEKTGGIGLQTARRQLELNHPDGQLEIKKNAGAFVVRLAAQLKKA